MNSTPAQRGKAKASAQTSRQSKSSNTSQASKTKTNAGGKKKRKRQNRGQDLNSSAGSSGRIGLSSVNRGRVKKSHLLDEDEYIADINGSVGFAATQYAINPGQAGTFPWGSKIAALYEKYEFTSLEFYYRREVSEFATNGQAGKVMLSVDFDASDSTPTSKQQVLDTEPHIDGMPCTEQLVLRVDCRQMCRQDGCFVRPGAQPANTDIKTYDAGNFYVSTYGNTNTSVVGELRVRYKCLLSVPVLEPAGTPSPGQPGSYLQLTSNTSGETAAATTTVGTLFALATTPVVIANGIGATIASTGVITLLAGSYLVEAGFTASDTAAAVTGGTLYLGMSTGNNAVTITGATSGADLSTHAAWISYSAPIVWNTSILGLTINMEVACTYASGTCLNQGYIKITLL